MRVAPALAALVLALTPAWADGGAGTPPSQQTAPQQIPPQRTGPEQTRLEQLAADRAQLGALQIEPPQPEQPIPGQAALLNFSTSLRSTASLTRVEAGELLALRLQLSIDGRPVPLPDKLPVTLDEAPSQPGSSSRLYRAYGSHTFNWPGSVGASFTPEMTRTAVVELRDRRGEAAPATRIVVVRASSASLGILSALGVIATLLVALAYFWFRRERLRNAEADAGPDSPASGHAGEEPAPPTADESEPLPAPVVPLPPPPRPKDYPALVIPDALTAAAVARQAVVVVGAGVSEQAGAPAGVSLIRTLVDRLGPNAPQALRPLLENESPAMLHAMAERLGGAPKLLEALIAEVPRDLIMKLIAELTPTAPGSLHALLAQIPWRAVVDLNLDGLMAAALEREKGGEEPSPVIATVNDTADLAQALRMPNQILFLPAGELERPTTVALTPEEMRRAMSRSPDFQRALAAMLQSQPFLFVGVAPDMIEQFLYAVGIDVEGVEPRHFALVPEDPANALRASTLLRFGVQLISYDPAPEAPGPRQFLRGLLAAARRSDLLGTGEAEETFLLAPDRVSRIRLENIGPFELLELEIIPPLEEASDGEASRGESPWWVLFGGNGVGKSSILRALGLALAGDAPAGTNLGARLLRAGAAHGLIEVQLGTQTLRTRLSRERSMVIVSSAQQTPVQLGTSLVLGFPALRGARGADPTGPTNRSEIREPEPADLYALIAGEVDGRLGDFKQWLVNTLVKADRDPRAAQMRTLLDDIIREIVPGQIEALAPLSPDDFVIRVRTPEGDIPFDDLSQGMASIFNWVGLLAQRLFTICERAERPQDESAIVIIDEVDAHLHPDWQRRLVLLTRRFFPNVQVIATSHSPLLAGSLRAHEMAVLGRDPETDRITPVPHIEAYGLNSQDILTSVFAMPTDRNPEVEDLIRRYFKLFEAPPDELNEVQRKELEQLRRNLRHYRYGHEDPVVLPLDDEAHIEAVKRRFGSPGEMVA